MSLKGMIALLVGALVALQAGSCACAPAPAISSVTASQSKESLKSQADETPQKPLPLMGGAQVNLGATGAPQAHASATANTSGSINTIKQQQQQQQQQIIKANSAADKLKRGLSNFMNQLNPASYFVPNQVQQPNAQQQQQQAVKGELAKLSSPSKASSQTSAETAAIVNGDPTADVLIKGPNRLTQTRPIGGPLRWG